MFVEVIGINSRSEDQSKSEIIMDSNFLISPSVKAKVPNAVEFKNELNEEVVDLGVINEANDYLVEEETEDLDQKLTLPIKMKSYSKSLLRRTAK